MIRNGRRLSLPVALMVAPEIPPRDVRELSGPHPLSGAHVANLSPAVAEELSISETSGVVILETEAYSIARRVGLRPGDIIVAVNGVEIESTRQLEQTLRGRARGWRLTVRRGGREIETVIAG